MPEILNEINWLDVLFVILLLGIVYKGLRIGVGGQILSLVGGVVLLYFAIGYYCFISEAIFGFLFQKWTKSISFFIISAGIFIFIKVLERLLSVVGNGDYALLERVGGAILAVFRAFVYFGIMGMCLLLIPIDSMKTTVIDNSKTCKFFINFDLNIYNRINDLINSGSKKKKIKPIGIEQFVKSKDS